MSQLPDITPENQTELEELALTLEAFQGKFLLIFARCNYDSLRSRLIQCLQDSSLADIRTITLNPDDTALYQRIQGKLQGDKPGALMVLGLESVLSLETMLAGADLVREEFRKHFPFPVVVWGAIAKPNSLGELEHFVLSRSTPMGVFMAKTAQLQTSLSQMALK
ncbi:MAG: hypothetical protein RIM23_02610 [Coleofasciculus sp. G3-WIS-01]|uniref:hypothetical protein n=1 Tax=Coleofasciculus sp. G3-WIS-01 TaxID=3069528 RepID=UPI0032F4B6C3